MFPCTVSPGKEGTAIEPQLRAETGVTREHLSCGRFLRGEQRGCGTPSSHTLERPRMVWSYLRTAWRRGLSPPSTHWRVGFFLAPISGVPDTDCLVASSQILPGFDSGRVQEQESLTQPCSSSSSKTQVTRDPWRESPLFEQTHERL